MWADHFSGETEVGNPDFEVLANKEVVKLEVSMADILRVHVAHCRHDLTSEEVSTDVFGEALDLRHNVK